MKQSITQQEGFTLLEVLVAVSIFTIGILSANIMQISSIKGDSTASRITTSSNWAAGRVEQLIGSGYANIIDTNGDGAAGMDYTDTVGEPADGTDTSPDGVYQIFWNVNDGQDVTNVKAVRVITRWSDRGGQRTLTLNYSIPEII
jgi:type IV pilus assembly protein PilV